jgi:hypothetical protein
MAPEPAPSDLDTQAVTGPAKVYPDAADPECWIVEPPTPHTETRSFTGPNAESAALEYAHRTYGSARFFTR